MLSNQALCSLLLGFFFSETHTSLPLPSGPKRSLDRFIRFCTGSTVKAALSDIFRSLRNDKCDSMSLLDGGKVTRRKKQVRLNIRTSLSHLAEPTCNTPRYC